MTHYPLDLKLLSLLEARYIEKRKEKLDSWVSCPHLFLLEKSEEEFKEIKDAVTYKNMQSEILDMILVLSMLYWRINPINHLEVGM